MIGTAPLSPTHDMNVLVRRLILRNGRRLMKMLIGRPAKIMNIPIRNDTAATESISCGLTSKPSIRKTTICASHVRPSMNLDMLLW